MTNAQHTTLPTAASSLELRPAPWQKWGMTLMPLVICGGFFVSFWFAVDGVWWRISGAAVLLLGVWLALIGRRQITEVRLRADAVGINLYDGTKRGFGNQHAVWDAVAECKIEKRSSGGDSGYSRCIVLKDKNGDDLFAISTQLCTRADNARLLRFIQTQLERHNGRFAVPSKYLQTN